MELTVSLQMYIPSWAQFPDHSHPLLLASQKLTERMQQRVRELNERNVVRGKFYQNGDDILDDETWTNGKNK